MKIQNLIEQLAICRDHFGDDIDVEVMIEGDSVTYEVEGIQMGNTHTVLICASTVGGVLEDTLKDVYERSNKCRVKFVSVTGSGNDTDESMVDGPSMLRRRIRKTTDYIIYGIH